MTGCPTHLLVFKEIIAMPLGGNTHFFGTYTSRPTESKINGWEPKVCQVLSINQCHC